MLLQKLINKKVIKIIIFMKIAEQSKIQSVEGIQEADNKIKSIQSLIKHFCSPESPQWIDQSTNLKQALTMKKIANTGNTDTLTPIQKTVKIKKRKRRQKKKMISLPNQLQGDKNFTHELCGCCSGKLDKSLTHDGYESEDECYADDPSQIQSVIVHIGEDLLEYFYDEIDKMLFRIMKDAESHHTRTFVKLMRKIGDVYEDFDSEFREEIQRQFEGQTVLAPLESSWCVPQKFKQYVIARFPLLKDFVQNFKLEDLDQKQTEQFNKLKSKNALIEMIFTHMEQIAAKKIKKKNKRQQQKLNKKLSDISQVQNPISMLYFMQEFSSKQQKMKIQDITERLHNMKISQKERTNCYFSTEWLTRVKNKMKIIHND